MGNIMSNVVDKMNCIGHNKENLIDIAPLTSIVIISYDGDIEIRRTYNIINQS